MKSGIEEHEPFLRMQSVASVTSLHNAAEQAPELQPQRRVRLQRHLRLRKQAARVQPRLQLPSREALIWSPGAVGTVEVPIYGPFVGPSFQAQLRGVSGLSPNINNKQTKTQMPLMQVLVYVRFARSGERIIEHITDEDH